MKELTREARRAIWAVLAFGATLLPASLTAQTRTVAPPEDTPRLMVAPFRGNEKGLGQKVTEDVIRRLTDDISYKKLFVIPKKYVCQNLEQSGFSCDSTPDPITSKLLATSLRADEYLEGSAKRTGDQYSVQTRMVLTRDNTMVQPLPTESGKDLGDLVKAIAKNVLAARAQLRDERKCELAIANGQAQVAATAAKAAITAYPQSTIGRVCLANAYLALKQPPDSIIPVTQKAIEIDPKNRPALAILAQAYKDRFDQTKDSTSLDRAVDTWAAMLAADPKNVKLVQDVTEKIAASGRAERAKPIIIKAVADNPGDPSLVHLKWLILLATKDYAQAVQTGEAMVQSDTAAADTTFFIRQAVAYALLKQPQKAAETMARGVAKFKNNAHMWSLNSQMQRQAGQTQLALESANKAIQLNPKAEHAYLHKAQLELDLNQPDSALAALRAGLANGEDTATVAQFVLAMGSQAYKAADSLKPPSQNAYDHAISVLAFADSLQPTPQAKFVMGIASFKVGDLAVRANQQAKTCDLAQKAQDAFANAQLYMSQGGSVDAQVAAQILGIIPKYGPTVDAQIKHFCKK